MFTFFFFNIKKYKEKKWIMFNLQNLVLVIQS